ncbi:MAG: hypothetical protein MZU97_18825 [Bacillus subtilis]|nr:hypothetical protein [Bacillus subtilis]
MVRVYPMSVRTLPRGRGNRRRECIAASRLERIPLGKENAVTGTRKTPLLSGTPP